jgi:hypothetical protein
VFTIFITISQNNLRFKIKPTQSTTACPSVATRTDRFHQGRFGPTIETRSIRRRINLIRRENRLSRREWQVVGERLGFGWLLVGKSERLLTARSRSRRRARRNNLSLQRIGEGNMTRSTQFRFAPFRLDPSRASLWRDATDRHCEVENRDAYRPCYPGGYN